MPKYEPETARLISTITGREIRPGEEVTTFRGEVTVFRYVSGLPWCGKSGKIFTDIRPGGEFYPGVVDARIEIADRFRSCTPQSIDGTLYIESLTDDVVVRLARDTEWSSPVLRKVREFMERGGPAVNPQWAQAEGARVAYDRNLIDGEELYRLSR